MGSITGPYASQGPTTGPYAERSHDCRPPVPLLFTRIWTCRCGQRWRVRPIRQQTPDGTAIAEAIPIGRKR